MADAAAPAGYSRQFALRQPPAARRPPGRDNFNVNKSHKRPTPWRLKDAAASSGQKNSAQPQKTLVDAFKQHGMRLCDGARLNAVGKGVHVLGRVPPTVCAPVTALYLSQNNLKSLEGIEQFMSVRLLSIGGNLIASDKEVARLVELAQLRNLNLMGNPLCDQPNYRSRVVAMLTRLQVLDNTDISKKEREAAPSVAAQDDALRAMVIQNHFDIQKLQRISQLIRLHKDFYGYVMAGVVAARFDRVPSPNDVPCNVKLLLRLWKFEDTLSEQEQEMLEMQMLTITIRTHAKLADNPKVKAKAYLLKLANGSSPRVKRQDGLSNDIKQQCASWEEAYANVIALQQKTIANLQAVCEKNRKEMVEYLKDLLSMDPRQRNIKFGDQRIVPRSDKPEMKSLAAQDCSPRRSWVGSRIAEGQGSRDGPDIQSSQYQLPPQQQDPDIRPDASGPRFLSVPPPTTHCEHYDTLISPHERRNPQVSGDRKAKNLRSGDFANKSLGEAISCFKLRDSTTVPHSKSSIAMAFPNKIPQVSTIYTVHRQSNVPFPSKLTERQRLSVNRLPGEQRLQQSTDVFEDEKNKTRRVAKVATDLNDSQRRVSSAFTCEDLDMTSISAISNTVSSPPRRRRSSEEVYVPVAESPPIPFNEQLPTPGSARFHTARSQSQLQAWDAPRTDPLQAKPTMLANDGRLQELEQREEKYIRALMQSEQRELDLRNSLSSVQRKLISYQRTLTHQLHEREAIKEEVAQRTMAVAAPKILKRFFIRWIQFYNWSLQLKHVHRKRCFVVQHDHFWLWKRKVWMQQELRESLKRWQLRTKQLHFCEWVNVTRVCVIAKRCKILQETRFLKNILHAWFDSVWTVKRKRQLLQKQHDRDIRQQQRLCFREWRRTTRYKTTLTRIQDLHRQDSVRISKQLIFWNWKIFIFSVARPIRKKSIQFYNRLHRRHMRLYFREWLKLIKVEKMYNARLCCRLWKRWTDWHRRIESEKQAAHTEKLMVVKAYFAAWHSTASEQATSRRSLSLAKRYVNRRRLRKLWMYWKYFSMAKRKYTQDSTKALKHYFMKLLRASWVKWKRRTHANLQKVKANKYGILQRHFDAFRIGIRLIRAQKARSRMLAHAHKRKKWSLLRHSIHVWRGQIVKRKRCKQNAKLVLSQRIHGALTSTWRHWRSLHVQHLCSQVSLLKKTCDSVVKEKHEFEAHLLAAKDTAMSLTDQIEILHEQSKHEDKQVSILEKKLRCCEEHNRNLENELKNARSSIKRERHAWDDALCEEEEKRENDSLKYRSLAQENQVLQVQIIELKRELEAEKSKVIAAEKVNDDLRTASVTSADNHYSEMTAAVNKQKDLEQEITELREHLQQQEMEREDTANRLQEYEKRIASTCEAMNEHEQAHERENERLRSECTCIEAKLKEEQVKNMELNQLLQEKNQTILNMTHRGSDEESRPCRDSNRGLEQCVALHTSQHYCGRRELRAAERHSCERHPPCKKTTKHRAAADPTSVEGKLMCQSRTLVSSRQGKQTTRHSNHAVPIRQLGKYTNQEVLQSSNHPTSRSEEALIDKHTSKVHEDIRLLQERISKRLEQVPAYAQLPPRMLQRARPVIDGGPESPISSSSSISLQDSDTTEDNQSAIDRVRRARLRRLQTRRQAVTTSVSSALVVPRLKKSTAFKLSDGENTSISVNKPKKKSARKSTSSNTATGRSQLKVSEKKVVKRHLGIASSGRML
ncbi:unnamed protein product [Phytophthora fragariaefolia]|uniref:Unnamed protein product n=1 Tax=Phytophthora fragariaefolia TaxID=1490495 RepID=A0A9W6WPI4_9STRA|nr:unnamed protein product [Phytophthora fragariaefolia]